MLHRSRRIEGPERDIYVGVRVLASLIFFEFAADYVYDNSEAEPQLAGLADGRVVPRDGLADLERRCLVPRVDVALLPLRFIRFETCAVRTSNLRRPTPSTR